MPKFLTDDEDPTLDCEDEAVLDVMSENGIRYCRDEDY